MSRRKENYVDVILKDMDVFTIKKFSDAYSCKVEDAADIYPFFEQYISDLKEQACLKKASGYQTAMNSFKKVDKETGFYKITSSWLDRFSRWIPLPFL